MTVRVYSRFVRDIVSKSFIVPNPRFTQLALSRRCQVAPRLGREATSSSLVPFQEPRSSHQTHWLVVRDSQTSQWLFSRWPIGCCHYYVIDPELAGSGLYHNSPRIKDVMGLASKLKDLDWIPN